MGSFLFNRETYEASNIEILVSSFSQLLTQLYKTVKPNAFIFI